MLVVERMVFLQTVLLCLKEEEVLELEVACHGGGNGFWASEVVAKEVWDQALMNCHQIADGLMT